jgi:ribonucleoside-diphosphate reductase alpha chain
MQVIKRNGQIEKVSFDKVLERHAKIVNEEPKINVDPVLTSQQTISYMKNNIKTSDLDVDAAFIAESKKLSDPEYEKFAARLYHSNMYKSTPSSFTKSIELICRTHEKLYVDTIHNVISQVNELFNGMLQEDIDRLVNDINESKLLRYLKDDATRIVQASKVISEVKFAALGDIEKDGIAADPSYNVYKNIVSELFKVIPSIQTIGVPYFNFIAEHANEINQFITDNASYSKMKDRYNLFALKTFEHMYLKKDINGNLIDRIAYCYMRIAIFCFAPNMELVKEYFKLMLDKKISHATPMFVRACYVRAQTISCIKTMADDNIESIMHNVYNMSKLSASGYGISCSKTNIRSNGAIIKSSLGKSKGIYPQMLIDSKLLACWDQGGHRPGAICENVDDIHPDIQMILASKRPNAPIETLGKRNISINVHDMLYKRAKEDKNFTLFSPHKAVGLNKLHGKRFEAMYEKYEKMGYGEKTLKARDLINEITITRMESGEPYITNIDQVNMKSNHINIGVCSGSNLCNEVMQYYDSTMYANCILGCCNYNCDEYFNDIGYWYDEKNKELTPEEYVRQIIKWEDIAASSYWLTRALNNSLDRNYFPIPEAEKGAMLLRSLGIGGQGLANVYARLRLPFTSNNPYSKLINKYFAEAKYYGFMEATCDAVSIEGQEPYHYFKGSPFSKGILQFHMWNVKPELFDWTNLIERVKLGTRNSQGTANMPTATTSQINNNVEAHEPFMSNIYRRVTKYGSYIILNNYMIQHLKEAGYWSPDMLTKIEAANGSIQGFTDIPQWIREIYKTVFEIKQMDLMRLSADRGPYVDQGESLNLYFTANPRCKTEEEKVVDVSNNITKCMFYSYELGLKTACYYTRVEVEKRYRLETLASTNNDKKKQRSECDEGCESCKL